MRNKPKEISLADAMALKDNCLVELKIDGSRLIWNGTCLKSDRSVNRNERFQHVFNEVRQLDWHVVGEIAIPDGNVLQLNRSENWSKAIFYVFDIVRVGKQLFLGASPFNKRKVITDMIDAQLSWQYISYPVAFKNFTEGWDFVERHRAEGLVLKSDRVQYKVKRLIEEKFPITGHIAGSVKGSFTFERNGVNCKSSGTSKAMVETYHLLVKQGITPWIEIEYQYLTPDGRPFQPRTRRVGPVAQW